MNAPQSHPVSRFSDDLPEWLLAVLGRTPAHLVEQQRETVELTGRFDLEAVVGRLTSRLREIEERAEQRVILLAWTLLAGPAGLRDLARLATVDHLRTALRRAAGREPRTVWTMTLDIAPTRATEQSWSEEASYTGAFVRGLGSVTRSAAHWTDAERTSLAIELESSPDEIATLLPDDAPALHVGPWSTVLLEHVLTTLEPTSGGSR